MDWRQNRRGGQGAGHGLSYFYANDDGLYPVSDNEPAEGFIERKKLNQKPTLKHKGSNETERCEMRSRGSAAKLSEY